MIHSTHSARRIVVRSLVTTCLVIGALGAPLVAVPASASVDTTLAPARKATIRGTITWTTITRVSTDDSGEYGPGDIYTSTTTDQGTVVVKLKRVPKYTQTFQVDGAGSKFTYDLSIDSQTIERNASGTNCTVTRTAKASSTGTFPKLANTTPPFLAARVVPGVNPPTIGRKTKGVVLMPVIPYESTATTTYVGSGLSPCVNATDVDPLTGNGLPSNSSKEVCYPSGSNAATMMAAAGELVGVWRQAKHRFVFDCSHTWTTIDGSVTTTVKGSLRYP